MKRRPSIRRALLLRVMIPLLALALVEGIASFGLARHFSQKVLDKWLYDSALSLAKQVHWREGRADIDLSRSALEILEWDESDLLYYEIISPSRGRIFGNAHLPTAPRSPQDQADRVYYDASVRDAPVRALQIDIVPAAGERITVRAAETRRKRDELSEEVLETTVLLSLLLVLASAALVWYGIGSGMTALARPVREVRVRHSRAPLRPLIKDDMPEEVLPLVDDINGLIEEVRQAHSSQQRFVADAAHQLRTPLASLQVQLELAQRKLDPNKQTGALTQSLEVLNRAAHLLHQLLTLAKVDEERADGLSFTPVDVVMLARAEVERRASEALGAGIDLGYSGPALPVTVQGNEPLLREALVNLLDNALRYSGGDEVTVGVSADPPCLFVEDRGIGIPENELSKIKNRFYRSPGTGGEGCGLGLAIVEQIAWRHGGRLVLEPGASGRGLRCVIILPRETSSPHNPVSVDSVATA